MALQGTLHLGAVTKLRGSSNSSVAYWIETCLRGLGIPKFEESTRESTFTDNDKVTKSGQPLGMIEIL